MERERNYPNNDLLLPRSVAYFSSHIQEYNRGSALGLRSSLIGMCEYEDRDQIYISYQILTSCDVSLDFSAPNDIL